MIEVVRQNWNHDKGFKEEIYKLEENKDMQLIIDDKIYASQISEFKVVKDDWNCDNDIYELFGAYFKINGYVEFFTPEDIVSMMIEEDCKIKYNK